MMRPTIEQLQIWLAYAIDNPISSKSPIGNDEAMAEIDRILDAQAQDSKGRCLLSGDRVECDGKICTVIEVAMRRDGALLILQVPTIKRNFHYATVEPHACTLIESEE